MALAYQSFNDAQAAARFLAERQEARLLGGGTLLVRRVNEGDISIGTYVRLIAPQLKQIHITGDTISLGAGVTMSAIAKSPALGFLAPAARSIGGPAVRTAATVGGNLFAPSPYGDFGVALLALDAAVSIESHEGLREFSLEAFFQSRGRLAPGSIVTAVQFARPAPGALPLRQSQSRQAEGRCCDVDRCGDYNKRGSHFGGADFPRRGNPGAGAQPGTGARGSVIGGTGDHARGGLGCCGCITGVRCDRQRMVSQDRASSASAPIAFDRNFLIFASLSCPRYRCS
jgi:hypothetical protein